MALRIRCIHLVFFLWQTKNNNFFNYFSLFFHITYVTIIPYYEENSNCELLLVCIKPETFFSVVRY